MSHLSVLRRRSPDGPAARRSPVSALGRLTALAVTAGLLAGCGGSAQTATGNEPPAADTVQIEVVPTTASGSDGATATSIASETGSETASGVAHTLVAVAAVPTVVARTEPDDGAEVVAELDSPLLSGTGLVFRVLDGGAASPDWVEVHLPIEPNGTTGWVRRSDITFASSPYRIEIDRATYSLRVYNLDQVWVETTIAVGTGDTPTPVGDFYLLELLATPNPAGDYGPFAFVLSGFSEVLDSFGGADEAIIGIHGTNRPEALGTDVSHGCIRVANDVIEQLAAAVPLGTPVRIT